MKKVIVASENPVKVAVAQRAFAAVYPGEAFEFIAVKSVSGVPDQPMNEETEQGALNRLEFIKTAHTDADFWISQEGGIYEENEKFYNRAWIVVADRDGHVGKSSTASFYLPKILAQYIREGMELGHAADIFFDTINSKHGISTIGHLTDGLLSREEYYFQSAIIALSEIKHCDWFLD